MSQDKKDTLNKELRLMEVSEDMTSISKRDLRDKIILPPAWDMTEEEMADASVESTVLH